MGHILTMTIKAGVIKQYWIFVISVYKPVILELHLYIQCVLHYKLPFYNANVRNSTYRYIQSVWN